MPTPSFYAHIADLCAKAGIQGAAAAAPGVVGRAWDVPSTYPVSTDIQDPSGFMYACARADLNALAVEGYERGNLPNDVVGRIGVVMAAKIAIDHMAAKERALHARHASPVRLRAWAASRKAGHADTTFGALGTAGRYVQSLVDQANSAPNSQA